MRKVLFKRFIPTVYVDVNDATKTSDKYFTNGKRMEGTGIWQPEYINEGLFHCWGVESDDRDTGVNTNTIALVELFNGEIEQVYPFNIKFTSPPESEYLIACDKDFNSPVVDFKLGDKENA